MDGEKVKSLFEQAEADQFRAGEELNRPSSDVVRYSACTFARRALHQYMTGLYTLYALENNDTPKESQTLDELIDYCGRHNPQIRQIDFSTIQCSCTDVMNEGDSEIVYCEDVMKVRQCKEIGDLVRDLLRSKL
ncbi:MAG: hypothetical protein ACQER4_09015 [Bacteroidota bacterium]